MIRVLITDKLAQEGIDLLNSQEDVEAVVKTGIGEDELAAIIGEYDGLIIRSGTKVTAKVLANPGKFRAVARAGVGVDNIDIPAATHKGVLVMNTPGGNTLSAAEHTMALMLSMSRNVVPACSSLKAGAWDRKKYMGTQLNGKVLGLIGLGRIGMSVAKMARGFDMKVLGYDPLAAPPDAGKVGVEVVDELDRIFAESDYISVHVPRNEQTLNMINADTIKKMKPTVRLINCARGGIINEDDAYDALAEGRIAGVAFDVYPKEPPENTRFCEFENCLVTPHPSTAGALPPIVGRYAELGRRIGLVMSTIAPGKIKNVSVQYRGTIAELDVAAVTLNFAIGLLQKHFDMPLNMVNVPVLSKERGISIDQTKNVEAQDVASSFSAKVVTDKMTRTVTGSIFGGTLMRIIDVDGFKIEMTPQGTVVVIFNDDKPGVIGAVGTTCGKHRINICTMGVGQKPEEQKAALAVSLDKEPDEKAVEELGKLDFVNEIYVCKLD